MPPGIPYIVANEAAERFSYYGMRAILVVFMTRYLAAADGSAAPMEDADARAWFHAFASAVYFFPALGAILSDVWLGKYRTILGLSLVYCAGHLALALDDTRTGLAVGLTLIAIGSGGIKPCVSAHVGDQFGASNAHLLERVFGWFYFAINLGAFASTLLTPLLLERYGPNVALGVPGALMALATWVFWLGRRRFVHVPATGRAFVTALTSRASLGALGRLALIYAFVAVFWALYDQTASAWVLQAERMDRNFAGVEWLSAQIGAINPILILAYIPLFSYVVYPALGRIVKLEALDKVRIGFFVAALAFLVPAWIEWRLAAGAAPNIAWQLAAYAILTAAEVLVSIPCLEFSYTQAPRELKSVVMAAFLMSVAAGNLFTAAVNAIGAALFGADALVGPGYYLLFAGLMGAAAAAFVPVSARYRPQVYLQPEG